MAVDQLPATCWVLDRPAGDYGEPHYETAVSALAAAADDYPEEKLTARYLPGGCWIVACDGECC
jgi:hypothetical protein